MINENLLSYRLGNRSDIPSILIMVKETIVTMENNNIFQWDKLYPLEEDFVSDINNGILYIVEKENNLVAFYSIDTKFDKDYSFGNWNDIETNACAIHRLCVNPSFQNIGYGKIILNHIEQEVKNKGYSSIRLDVFSGNPYALNLYKHNNYAERGTFPCRKGLFILMEKSII